MVLVSCQLEIFVLETEQVPPLGIDLHFWQRIRFTTELGFHLFKVIQVDVDITKGVNKVARLQTYHLCNHHGKQCIRGDIERHTEKDIGAALIHLAAELAVSNVELEHRVTRRQCLQTPRSIFPRAT